jgi:hypothetical protein
MSPTPRGVTQHHEPCQHRHRHQHEDAPLPGQDPQPQGQPEEDRRVAHGAMLDDERAQRELQGHHREQRHVRLRADERQRLVVHRHHPQAQQHAHPEPQRGAQKQAGLQQGPGESHGHEDVQALRQVRRRLQVHAGHAHDQGGQRVRQRRREELRTLLRSGQAHLRQRRQVIQVLLGVVAHRGGVQVRVAPYQPVDEQEESQKPPRRSAAVRQRGQQCAHDTYPCPGRARTPRLRRKPSAVESTMTPGRAESNRIYLLPTTGRVMPNASTLAPVIPRAASEAR